jgi:hypothetical protein
VDKPQGLRPELFRIACVLENHREYLDQRRRLDRIEIAGWRDLGCRCRGARGLPVRGPSTWVQTGTLPRYGSACAASNLIVESQRQWPRKSLFRTRKDAHAVAWSDETRRRCADGLSLCGIGLIRDSRNAVARRSRAIFLPQRSEGAETALPSPPMAPVSEIKYSRSL